MTQLHENYGRSDADLIRAGSERSFGFVFAVVFGIVGFVPVLSGGPIRWWAVLVAGVLAAAALLRPQLLMLPNRCWHKLGVLLAAVVGPVAIFLVYALAVVPTGLLMRALRKDPLRLRLDRKADSYWIERQPP